VLVIRRIHVRYRLRIDPAKRDVAERVLGLHADSCPVARSFRGCIDISTSLDMEGA
jgi:organic hydroperoxide reductase OsmC/OhrA